MRSRVARQVKFVSQKCYTAQALRQSEGFDTWSNSATHRYLPEPLQLVSYKIVWKRSVDLNENDDCFQANESNEKYSLRSSKGLI